MARAELLARMNPANVRFDVGAGGIPALTMEMIAGACAYGRLPLGAYYLGLAKYAGDASAANTLEYHAWIAAAGLAAERKWAVERGKPYLRGISRVACCLLLDKGRCGPCGGTGLNSHHRACRVCEGTGVGRPISARREARMAGIPSSSYDATWRSRMLDVRDVLLGWDSSLGGHLKRQLEEEAP